MTIVLGEVRDYVIARGRTFEKWSGVQAVMVGRETVSEQETSCAKWGLEFWDRTKK